MIPCCALSAPSELTWVRTSIRLPRKRKSSGKPCSLAASRGSDFHGPDEGRVDLGELPALPDSLVPVWIDWN